MDFKGMEHLSQLSLDQQAIALHLQGGLAVIAGAGSGKTTTLVERCVEFSKKFPELRIAAVSFTEKSAQDLKAKLKNRFLEEQLPYELHWVGTIHGFCASIIKEFVVEAGVTGQESITSAVKSQQLWQKVFFDLLKTDALFCKHVMETSLSLSTLEEKLWGLYQSHGLLLGELQHPKRETLLGSLKASQALEEPMMALFIKLFEQCFVHYQRFKKRQGWLDFQDLEQKAYQVVNDEASQKVLQQRYGALLIDEFQDTSPLQASILLKVAKPDYSNVCMVGDPKQSIYRFRDADVSVFEELIRVMPTQRTLSLNYRSHPDLISFVNMVCAPIFKASSMDFLSLSHPSVATVLPEVSNQILLWDVGSFAEVSNILAQCIADKTIDPSQTAILLRKIRGYERLFTALDAAGVPWVLRSGGVFWEDPRIRECVALLRWWEHPLQTLSGVTFLRAPWVGIEDSVIDLWIQQGQNLLNSFLATKNPVAQQLAPLRSVTCRPGEVLLRLLNVPAVQAELAYMLLPLWQQLESYSYEGLGFHDIVLILEDMLEKKPRHPMPPLSENQDAALGRVSIMSIHAAKGLEFSYVVMLDGEKRPKSAQYPFLLWHRYHGACLQLSSYYKPSSDAALKRHAFFKDLEQQQQIADSKRLFYVALTRAKEKILFFSIGPLQESPQALHVHADYWYAYLKLLLPSGYVWQKSSSLESFLQKPASSPPLSQDACIIPAQDHAYQRARHSVTEWLSLQQCERQYIWRYIHPPFMQHTSVASKKILRGIQIHAILASSKPLEALKKAATSLAESYYQTLKTFCSQHPLMQSHPDEERYAELAFEVPLSHNPLEVLVGAIDSVILKKTPGAPITLQILDFKISEAPQHKILHRYAQALQWYTAALRLLDPLCFDAMIQPSLIMIRSHKVDVLDLPILSLDDRPAEMLRAMAAQSNLAIHRYRQDPKVFPQASPSSECRYCEFLEICPSGKKT